MQDEIVVFPDVTDAVVGYLRSELGERGVDVPVRSKVPDPRPDRFVRVRRLGGPRRDVVTDLPQVTVEAWDDDDAGAHDLAQLCRGLVFALRGTVQDGVVFYRVEEFAGPQELPDPDSDQPRYVFTVQIATRGTAESGS